MNESPNAQVVVDVARQSVDIKVTEVDPSKVLAVRGDQDIKVLELEHLLPAPRRARGEYKPATVDSFVAYVTKHLDREHTTIWVPPLGGSIVALLNDHAPGEPAWRDHKARLVLQHTEEWKRWTALDGRLVDQQTFAEHIEESQLDIVQPDAADVLEIAESFQATTSSQFKSAQRLATGQVHFTFVEDVEAKAGLNGELDIPTKIELSIAPFLGERACAITALLRYRVREGKLSIGYKLVRPTDVIRDAIDLIAERLQETFPRVYLGEPA
jgi:uncharacterized protein YfdQ (DUF2303 family)